MKLKKISNLILSTAITFTFADSACKAINNEDKCEQTNNQNSKGSENKITGENGIVPSSSVKGTPLNAIYF